MRRPYSQPRDIGTGGFRTWKEVQWVLLPRCIFAGSEEEITSYAIYGFEEKEYYANESGTSDKAVHIPRLEQLRGVIVAIWWHLQY